MERHLHNSDAVAPAKTASAGSSVYSGDDNTQEDEIDRLSKAIVGLQTFQNLPPLSPKKRLSSRGTAQCLRVWI